MSYLQNTLHIEKSYSTNLNSVKKDQYDTEDVQFKNILLKKTVNNKSLKNEALMEACYQFEAIFIEKIFKVAQNTLSEKNMFGDKKSFMENWATEQLYQNYSKSLSKTNSFGLAQRIYDQLI